MDKAKNVCPECDQTSTDPSRRDFLRTAGIVAATSATNLWAVPTALASGPTPKSPAETSVKALYDTLTEEQKKVLCFEWDYIDPKRGLLRTHVSNNWQITEKSILSNFFTKQQQTIAYDIFRGLINPQWEKKFLKQLKDDTSGKPWGAEQSIAIFGKPGEGKFEFVMTGRHMTIRADGNSEAHVAFGGPIFYGHAASGFDEKVHHPGNVFWHQAEGANRIFTMLDGKQQKHALVPGGLPKEAAVAFRRDGMYPGLPVSEMSSDQKKELEKVLALLVEPYRIEDQDEVKRCLAARGGLEKCSLAFYEAGDLGADREWDNWRLEGPSFVWYFRGFPHVHVWVNIADDASVALNARG